MGTTRVCGDNALACTIFFEGPFIWCLIRGFYSHMTVCVDVNLYTIAGKCQATKVAIMFVLQYEAEGRPMWCFGAKVIAKAKL